jgi:hypothetical protein
MIGIVLVAIMCLCLLGAFGYEDEQHEEDDWR